MVVRSRFFFLTLPPPPRSTLFPYTTLFRSLVTAKVRFALEMTGDGAQDTLRHERRARIIQMNPVRASRSEEHTSELQSHSDLVCRLLLEKKKKKIANGDKIKDHAEHQHQW